MEINYRHLWKAKYVNVIRLAKALDIVVSECICNSCRANLIDKVARKL